MRLSVQWFRASSGLLPPNIFFVLPAALRSASEQLLDIYFEPFAGSLSRLCYFYHYCFVMFEGARPELVIAIDFGMTCMILLRASLTIDS